MPSRLALLIGISIALHIALNILVISRIPSVNIYEMLLDLLGVVCGLYVADLFSNLIHWVGDSKIEFRSRFMRRFQNMSREHHRHPAEILQQKFFAMRGNIAYYYAPLLVAAFILAEYARLTPVAFMCLTIANLLLIAHSIHKACHARRTPIGLRLLQKLRIIISAEYHRRHHTPPYNRNFAAINGWSDPLFIRLVSAFYSLSGPRKSEDK